MKYLVYNESDELRGTFESIYDLEKYVDGVRDGRGEHYPITPRMSPFDYLRSIGWFLTITDNVVSEVNLCQ